MTTQMIIRVESGLKDKVSRLARSEGKNLSELVRDLLEKYTKERDMPSYIDDLWGRIGNKLLQTNPGDSDIEDVIKQVRSDHAQN